VTIATRSDRSRVVVERRPIVRDCVRLDLIDPLIDEIVERVDRGRSAPSLNEGGWRSDSLRGWTGPAVRALLCTLEEMTSATELEAWAMVNWRGSRHPRHIHRGAILAGVYYVRAGDDRTPPTIFEPPHGPEIHVEPLAGRLVVFPGDLYHRVPAYHGDEPRITVAFDVRG